jgi:aminoglycoside 2''-phosphotransferase
MIDGESYWHQQVHSIMPDLEINSLKFHQEGLVNEVLIVNDEWVFRFTKTEWGKEQMAVEGQLMRYLQARLPLSIPNPEVMLPGVIVYPYLQGKIFTRDVWRQMDGAGQQHYADQLGQFVKDLHTEDLNGFNLEVPPTLAPVTKETWEDVYERLENNVYPHLLPHQAEWSDALFDTALGSPGFFEFVPVLVHGDLASYHILYSPNEKNLKAVIDFGVAGLGDPATDLGSLINCYGESLVGKMADVYPEMVNYLPRARFYAQAIELQWALLGVESGEYYWFTAHIGGARDIHY